jgi:hypothetical protein
MNQTIINLTSLLSNPHLRYPVLGVFALEAAKTWVPQYSNALDVTEKLLAVYLIGVAASNGPASGAAPKQ